MLIFLKCLILTLPDSYNNDIIDDSSFGSKAFLIPFQHSLHSRKFPPLHLAKLPLKKILAFLKYFSYFRYLIILHNVL